MTLKFTDVRTRAKDSALEPELPVIPIEDPGLPDWLKERRGIK